MAKLMKNALILAKLETTIGTDVVPTGSANAILCKGITPQPIVTESADRDNTRPYFGASEKLVATVHSEIEFEVELAGSGAAGTAPKWSPLLQACGFSETITEDTDVKYAPITSGSKTVSIYYYLDGILHKLLGSRGAVSFGLSAGGIPTMKFKYVGLYSEPTDAVTPANVDYSDFITPKPVNALNTPTWALHGYTGKMSKFDIDMGVEVKYRELIGGSGVEMTGRGATASATFELPSVASKNWARTITTGESGALTLTHGTTAGNIIQIDAPRVQLSDPSYSDDDGVAMMNAKMSLVPAIGNDEIIITVK